VRLGLPIRSGPVGEPEVRLVNERCRVQRFIAFPMLPLSLRRLVELVIDERQQLVVGPPVPLPQLREEMRHCSLTRVAHVYRANMPRPHATAATGGRRQRRCSTEGMDR